MSRVVHFEIHAKDMDKLQKFYADAFGWTFQDMGTKMGNYRVITTGTEAIGINGGLTPRGGKNLPQPGDAVNAFVSVIGVEDIDGTIAKIEKAGGTVALEKMDVPEVGLLAYYKDLEGNIFGVIQPVMPEKK
jgi:uncharacterized protein